MTLLFLSRNEIREKNSIRSPKKCKYLDISGRKTRKSSKADFKAVLRVNLTFAFMSNRPPSKDRRGGDVKMRKIYTRS